MAVGETLYDPGRDYSKAPLLPAGQYDLMLKSATDDWHVADSEYETRTLLFETVGDVGGRRLYVSISLSPRAFLTPMFLQACGVTEAISDRERLKKVIDGCIEARLGTTFKQVTIGQREAGNGYAAKNTVRKFAIDPAVKELWKNGNGTH